MADQNGSIDAGVEQPGAGDGGTSEGSLPWDLNSAPEELRPYLQSELKKIEGGITKRFQEASEFRSRMEPLSGLAEIEGIADVPTEELQELLEFRSLVQDPEQFEDWWSSVGEEMGFFQGDDAPDDADDGGSDEPPEWAQTLMERLDNLEGTTREQTAAQREQAAMEKINSDLTALGLDPNGEEADAVCQLAMAYDDEDAIQKAFADYQKLTGKAQSALVDDKENAPAAPLGGGQADTAPEAVNGFVDAKRLAKARFAGAR